MLFPREAIVRRSFKFGLSVLLVGGLATSAPAAEKLGLKKGDVQLQSAGPLTFGPDGILFIGDPKAATVYAVDTGDKPGQRPFAELEGELKLPDGAKVVDLAVNPQNGTAYVSVAGKEPAILRVKSDGATEPLSLKGVPTSKAALPNAPEDKVVGEGRRQKNPRSESITDLAFVDSQVLVSGLTANNAPSSVEALPFPFGPSNTATSLEIYHGAHGKLEDYAPIRVFVPFNIDGKPHLLAGFTCTPLVKFPLAELDGKEKVRGTTVAELGNRNQPLDMIAYEKNGQTYLLMANSARGVMKISTADIEDNPGINDHIPDGNTAGQSFESINDLKDVKQLDKLDDKRGVVLQETEGRQKLTTIELP
jgi:hypothetical protein